MFRWFRRNQGNYDTKRLYTDHLDSVRHFSESHPGGVVDNPRQEIFSAMAKEILEETEDQ